MMATFESVAHDLRGLVPNNRHTAMTRVTIAGVGIVQREVPVKRGTLRRAITSRVEAGGDRGVIGTNLRYARPVHEGSKPHIIRPKAAKALFWKGARHPVRAVRHPGTKPNKYLERGAVKLRPVAERELASTFGAALARIG